MLTPTSNTFFLDWSMAILAFSPSCLFLNSPVAASIGNQLMSGYHSKKPLLFEITFKLNNSYTSVDTLHSERNRSIK